MSISREQEDMQNVGNVAGAWSQNDINIDNMLCFALYAASRAIMDAYRPLLHELDLTYPQYLVMIVLWERETSSVKELGTILHLDSGTLSPLLKRLECAGFITRQRRASDERVVDIALTEEGHLLKTRAAHIPIAVGCQYGIDFDEYIELLGRLKKLTEHLSTSTW